MMRKLFAVMLVVFCASRAWGAYYDNNNSGDSWETAYVINSAEDFILMRDRVNNYEEPSGKYYKLNSDIDLTAETDWEGINGFSGHFDGQNHTITLNSQTNDLYAALFWRVSTENGQIAIRNLNVTGTVNAECAGTIVHYLDSGIIDNCTFTGTITTEASSSIFGAGGIAAHMSGGSIRNCRVNANISAGSYGGGIVGALSGGNIENCTVEDNTRITAENIGGIAGRILSSFNGNISGCTWPEIYPLAGSGSYTQTITEITWNGHRYRIYNENLTWEQAKLRCEALGGHLATITSRAEQNEIEELLREARKQYYGYWLGAKADELGFWHWVTDEVFEQQYNNYAQGQPDGSGNYLQIYAQSPSGYEYYYVPGKWDDTANNGTNSGLLTEHGFICEWDDEPEQVEAALPNPEFVLWLDNLSEYEDPSEDVYGAIPGILDMSHLRNNPPRTSEYRTAAFSSAADEPLSVSFDTRLTSGLPEVRNQKVFDTCWAFASLGAMEANYMKQGLGSLGKVPDLSELHLAWFLYKHPTSNKKKNYENSGILQQRANPEEAINFLKGQYTPVNESEMSYDIAGDVKAQADGNIEAFINTRPEGISFDKAAIKLTDVKKIGPVIDIPRTKEYIKNNGAVFFQFYNIEDDGYDYEHNSFFTRKGGGTYQNKYHAALLVGWDDNYPKENFRNNPSVDGAWLVRNSYGTEKNDKGYFWLSYEMSNPEAGVYVITDAHIFTVSEDEVMLSEDKPLLVGPTKIISRSWASSIFHSRRDENLEEIVFFTPDNNTQCEIYVNNLGKEKPTDPGQTEEPLIIRDFPYAGFHTVKLPVPVELYNGDYYSVILKTIIESDYEFSSAVEASIENYVSVDIEAQESFFADGDIPSVWEDGKFIDDGPFNAYIRAFTKNRISYENAPQITTSTLPAGKVGEEYNFSLDASGSGTLEWRSGNLPEGIALTRHGLLNGSPVNPGSYELKITALNNIDYQTKILTLEVAPGDISSIEPVSDDIPESQDVPITPEHPIDLDIDNEIHNFSGSGGGGSGGCNSGFEVLCVIFAMAFVLKKHEAKK